MTFDFSYYYRDDGILDFDRDKEDRDAAARRERVVDYQSDDDLVENGSEIVRWFQQQTLYGIDRHDIRHLALSYKQLLNSTSLPTLLKLETLNIQLVLPLSAWSSTEDNGKIWLRHADRNVQLLGNFRDLQDTFWETTRL